MTVDLVASNLSEVMLFGQQPENDDAELPLRRIFFPADATIRVAGTVFRLRPHQTSAIGPCDLTYELVS